MKLPLSVDSVKNDGEFGDGGPDPRSGFDSYSILDADGLVLFDSLNRDGSATEIHEEGDSYEGHYHAWDEAAKRDAELVVRALNSHDDLVAALQYAERFIAGAMPHFVRDREEAVEDALPYIRATLAKAGAASGVDQPDGAQR